MQARYYDPVIGRFLSNDPVGFAPNRPQYFNRYSYALNDPINMIDPDGEKVYAWTVRLVRGGLIRVKALADKKHAIAARRQQENILLNNGTRQSATAVERAAAKNPNDVIVHTKGHELRDGSGKRGLPHAQTDGVRGHTFYSVASAVLGAAIAVSEVAEQLDPINLISGDARLALQGVLGLKLFQVEAHQRKQGQVPKTIDHKLSLDRNSLTIGQSMVVVLLALDALAA